MILFQCTDGDYEGDATGAIHHCDLTGHTLTRTATDGTVTTISLDIEDVP